MPPGVNPQSSEASSAEGHFAVTVFINGDEGRADQSEMRPVPGAGFNDPPLKGLKLYLEARLRQISAKSKLGEAMRFALSRWMGSPVSRTTVASTSTRTPSSGRSGLFALNQERAFRRIKRRRRQLGGDRHTHRELQALRHQSSRLAHPNPHRSCKWSPGNHLAELMPWPPCSENIAYH